MWVSTTTEKIEIDDFTNLISGKYNLIPKDGVGFVMVQYIDFDDSTSEYIFHLIETNPITKNVEKYKFTLSELMENYFIDIPIKYKKIPLI